MRTTIWIPDELAKDMKEEAWRQRKSLSAYLVGLHKGTQWGSGGVKKEILKPVELDITTGVVKPVERAAGFFNPMPKGKG